MEIEKDIWSSVALEFGNKTTEVLMEGIEIGTDILVPGKAVIGLLFIWYKYFKNRKFLGVSKMDICNERHRISVLIVEKEERIELDKKTGNDMDRRVKEREVDMLRKEHLFLGYMLTLHENMEFLERKGVYEKLIDRQLKLRKHFAAIIEKFGSMESLTDEMVEETEKVIRKISEESK